MRKLLLLTSALALAAGLFAGTPMAATTAKKTAAPARKAGEFVIKMADGKDKLLSSYRGKFVVLAFMHTTCSHCQHLSGVLSKIQTDYEAKGVQVVGVTFNADAKRDLTNFIKTFGVNFPCGYSDHKPVEDFVHAPTDAGYSVPIMDFIDRTGTIRSQYLALGDGGPAEVFLSDPDKNIRKEIDKYLKAPATVSSAKKTQ